MTTEPLRVLLEQAFPDAQELRVIDRGGGDHLEVQVTAPSLDGLSRIDQHRRVYDALAAPLADDSIH
jgi:stress-induced morphogen